MRSQVAFLLDMLGIWISSQNARSGRRRPRAGKPLRQKPCLEGLEERVVPAFFSVVGTVTGSGSWSYSGTEGNPAVLVGDGGSADFSKTYAAYGAGPGIALSTSPFAIYDPTNPGGHVGVGIDSQALGSNGSLSGPDLFVHVTGSTSGNAKSTFQISPDVGEKMGDPVHVHLAATDQSTGGAFQYVISGAATGTGDFTAKIGDTITISLQSSATASSDDGDVEGKGHVDLTLTTPSATATSVDWDPEKGGVNYSYQVAADLPQAPKINFYWSPTSSLQGATRIPGTIFGQTKAQADDYTGHVPPSTITTPPSGAKYLLMAIQSGQNTSVVSTPYNPTVTVKPKYGVNEGGNTFGRYFAGASMDEVFTVSLSDDLAALRPQASEIDVRVGPGDQKLSVTEDSDAPAEFETQTFDPGHLNGDAPLTVTVSRGGPDLAPVENTLHVVQPQLQWLFGSEKPQGSFDPGKKAYVFSHSLVNLNTSQAGSINLPKEVWLGGGAQSGVNLQANAQVIATLDPAADVTVNGKATGQVTFLGQKVVDLNYSYPSDGGKFNVTLQVDPKDLSLKSGTITLSDKGNQHGSLSSGMSFSVGILKTKPNLSADLSYNLQGTLTVDSHGNISSGSKLAFDLSADNISGDLRAEIDMPLAVAAKIVKLTSSLNLPGALLTLLQKAGLVPEGILSGSLSGNMSLGDTVLLSGSLTSPTGTLQDTPHGSVKLTPQITGGVQWLGHTLPIINLQPLTDLLTVSTKF